MTARVRTFLVLAVLAGSVSVTVWLASSSGASSRPAATTSATRPNIVFILADDLSWNLVTPRIAPHIVALERRGETFTNYFVADSLCCPSRSTIFTGLFPHDTKVVTNVPPDGGFQKFQSRHLDRRTFAVAVRRRGYLTSMSGKYLNGYGDPSMTSSTAPVPPGWTDWHVSNHTGYGEFNYVLNDNGRVDQLGGPTGGCGQTGTPDNYGVDVAGSKALSFIGRAKKRPFVLEVATFAPHAPYIPAPRNACDFPGLTEPRDPSFNTPNTNAPAWLAKRGPLTADQVAQVDKAYRMRAQAVESVDKLVADVEAKLAATGLARNTYIVFSSDNGYHLGQHQLPRGKQTPFDTDIRVPLIVAGPGVPKGRKVPQVTQNVDLYPTFVALAGAEPRQPVDGHSLVPLLHPRGGSPPRWRTVALVEHHHLSNKPNDPDNEERHGRNPTTYEAIRITARRLPHFRGPVDAVYVEYKNPAHELEYYDIRRDPFERHNIAYRVSAAQHGELHRVLVGLEHCHSSSACWKAGLPQMP
jgi:N-acetylglucosamine-6-sulfatase